MAHVLGITEQIAARHVSNAAYKPNDVDKLHAVAKAQRKPCGQIPGITEQAAARYFSHATQKRSCVNKPQAVNGLRSGLIHRGSRTAYRVVTSAEGRTHVAG